MLSGSISHRRPAASGRELAASRAGRSLKPLVFVVQFLKCVAMAAVVYVVGTVTCFYQSRERRLDSRDDGRFHVFASRPMLCSCALLAACAAGLCLRARPRLQKLLALHDKRSLLVRAALAAAIVVLEVRRRLSAKCSPMHWGYGGVVVGVATASQAT